MTDTPEAVLKPCPFCGGEAMQSENRAAGLHWWQIECVARLCSAVGPTAYDTEAAAITAWNTRPDADIVRQLVEALEKARPFVSPSYFPGTGETMRERIDEALTTARAAGYGGQS